MIICNCNFVERDEIVEAIKEEGAQTIEDIRRLTGANTSCGRCGAAVEAILKMELKKLENSDNKKDKE